MNPRLYRLILLAFFLVTAPLVQFVKAAELDLKDTPYGQGLLSKFAGQLRIGNQGKTEFEKLTYDTTTRDVKGTVRVNAKHSWGKITWTDYFSIPPVDNEFDIAVSTTAKAEFIYNIETQDVAAGLRFPLGERSITVLGKKYKWDFGELRLSADQMKRILDGDLTALTESIPNLGFFVRKQENDYDKTFQSLENKYGAGNVYLARKVFVDKMKPSQGFNYTISLIVTGGGSGPAIMKSLGNLALSEVTSLSEWLEDRGVNAAEKIAKSILEGKGVRVPNFYIALKWTTIEYRSRVLFQNEIPITPWIRENHGAFYLIVKERTSGTNSNIDDGGFDTGPFGSDDFPDRRVDGTLTPDDRFTPFFGGAGIDASNFNSTYEIDVVNESGKKIRVAILRGANDPSFWSRTFLPGNTIHTHAGGASERVVGVWELDRGKLVLMLPLVIDKDLKITVGRDPINDQYWLGAIPRE